MADALSVPDMPFDQYVLQEGLNQSTLKHGLVSTKKQEHESGTRVLTTGAMQLGTAVHAALLEPDDYFNRRKIEPTAFNPVTSRTNKLSVTVSSPAWQNVIDNRPGQIILSPDMPDIIERIQFAVSGSREASELFDKKTGVEHSYFWQEGGIKMKARIDMIGDGWIADIKTTSKIGRHEFIREAANRKYYFQAAMYSRAYYKVHGVVPDMYYIAIETAEPHGVQVFRVSDRTRMTGLRQLAEVLENWQRYIATGEHTWFGSEPGQIEELELPSYLLDDDAVFSSRQVAWEKEDLIHAGF